MSVSQHETAAELMHKLEEEEEKAKKEMEASAAKQASIDRTEQDRTELAPTSRSRGAHGRPVGPAKQEEEAKAEEAAAAEKLLEEERVAAKLAEMVEANRLAAEDKNKVR